MTIRLTPDVLRSAYAFLCTTGPFMRWKLPHPETVKFVVSRSKDKRGDYEQLPDGTHCIRVSALNSGHTINVVATVAHEMVHLYQKHHKTPGHRSEHGAEFLRLAAQVCRYHGFDAKAF